MDGGCSTLPWGRSPSGPTCIHLGPQRSLTLQECSTSRPKAPKLPGGGAAVKGRAGLWTEKPAAWACLA